MDLYSNQAKSRTRRFQSFVRQLNLYGFFKVSSVASERVFCHTSFRRNMPELLSGVRRRISSDKPRYLPETVELSLGQLFHSHVAAAAASATLKGSEEVVVANKRSKYEHVRAVKVAEPNPDDDDEDYSDEQTFAPLYHELSRGGSDYSDVCLFIFSMGFDDFHCRGLDNGWEDVKCLEQDVEFNTSITDFFDLSNEICLSV